jgi:DDE superfamily endonuclease/Transposase, Mutator family
MQHLLSRAVWDADQVRDDVRDAAVEHLGDTDAMLVVDETGDVTKGGCTVGVQRHCTGTAGRIENAQVGVFLTYTTKAGHTRIDRELYLPRSWTSDTDRCAAAGVPADTGFATKPALASRMILRALDGGVLAGWVAEEVYGGNPTLRGDLEARQVGYVLAVACDHRVTAAAGTCRADELVVRLPSPTGLTGLPEAINTVWSQAITQTCIVHLLRNGFRYAGPPRIIRWSILELLAESVKTAVRALSRARLGPAMPCSRRRSLPGE